jgi:hypothetical protein
MLRDIIKVKLYNGLNSGDPDKLRHIVQDILWIISKEEENEKLRFRYYEELKATR